MYQRPLHYHFTAIMFSQNLFTLGENNINTQNMGTNTVHINSILPIAAPFLKKNNIQELKSMAKISIPAIAKRNASGLVLLLKLMRAKMK